MDWHYEKHGRSEGPVTGRSLQDLHRSGEISDETLVWEESMLDWRKYRDCVAAIESSPLPIEGLGLDPSGEALAVCAWSGKTFPESQMLRYGDQWVAPEYKDLFVQRLREGVLIRDDDGIPAGELVTDLHPVTILIQAAKIWRKNALVIVLILAVVFLPLALVAEYLNYQQEPEIGDEGVLDWIKSLRSSHPFETLVNLMNYIFVGATLFAAHRSWTGNPGSTFGAALYAGAGNFLRLLGTNLLYGILAGLLCIPGAILVAMGHWATITLGAIYLIVALAVYLTRHAFIDPIAIADSHGGMHALERSRGITRGRFWRVLLMQGVLYGVFIAATMGSSFLLIIPGLDNFIASAFHTMAVDLLMAFLWIETYVFHRHLEANPA